MWNKVKSKRENAQPPETDAYPRPGNMMEHETTIRKKIQYLLRRGCLHNCVSQLSTFGARGLITSLMGVSRGVGFGGLGYNYKYLEY